MSDTIPKAIRVNGHLYRRAGADWRAGAAEQAIDEMEELTLKYKVGKGPGGRSWDVAIQALYTLNAIYNKDKDADRLLESVFQSLKYLQRDLANAPTDDADTQK